MAKKANKHFRLDEGILNEFVKITKKKKAIQSEEVEEMMKQYISRDGEMIFDDLYAPRISHAVKQAVDEQINRLAKMIYKTQVDATASLYSAPVFHNQTLKGIEDVLDMYINGQLLNPNRQRISENHTLNTNGKNAIHNLRKIALTDHKEQKSKDSKEAVNK